MLLNRRQLQATRAHVHTRVRNESQIYVNTLSNTNGERRPPFAPLFLIYARADAAMQNRIMCIIKMRRAAELGCQSARVGGPKNLHSLAVKISPPKARWRELIGSCVWCVSTALSLYADKHRKIDTHVCARASYSFA
jgi:hypothetical protein